MKKSPKWTMEDYQNNQVDYGENFEKLYQAWLDKNDQSLTEIERLNADLEHKNRINLERLLDQQDREIRRYLKLDESPLHKYPNGMQAEVRRILQSGKHTIQEVLEKMSKRPQKMHGMYRIIADLRMKFGDRFMTERVSPQKNSFKRFWIEV